MPLWTPRWTHVASSIFEAVAYDPAGRRLRIRFRSGAIYDFAGVPPVVFEELLAAPSKDGYFAEYVRPITPTAACGAPKRASRQRPGDDRPRR